MNGQAQANNSENITGTKNTIPETATIINDTTHNHVGFPPFNINSGIKMQEIML